jgi:hypothetical protein
VALGIVEVTHHKGVPMPDDAGRYNALEQRDYQSPPCPECGGRTIQTWIDATGVADPIGANLKIPGTYRCASPQSHTG